MTINSRSGTAREEDFTVALLYYEGPLECLARPVVWREGGSRQGRGGVVVASWRGVSLAATQTMVLFQILKGSVRERESEGNNFSPNDTIDYISTQHANGPF